MPNSPKPLLGRDLLEKVEAEIRLKDGEVEILIPESKYIKATALLLQDTNPKRDKIPRELEDAVIPIIWQEKFQEGLRERNQ